MCDSLDVCGGMQAWKLDLMLRGGWCSQTIYVCRLHGIFSGSLSTSTPFFDLHLHSAIYANSICIPPCRQTCSTSPQLLLQNIGKALYKDKEQIIASLRKSYPPFKETKEFEFAFKIRWVGCGLNE
jgi:hypothetical protein